MQYSVMAGRCILYQAGKRKEQFDPVWADDAPLSGRTQPALNDQARALGVSIAYLSSLERGMKSRPSAALAGPDMCLATIWDEVETLKSLAALSHPRPPLNTGTLAPEATMLANLWNIDRLSAHNAVITELLSIRKLNLPQMR